jgi:hypothetical protein
MANDTDALETISGRKFANETVHLDGREFIDCNFDRCLLIYSGGNAFIFGNSPINACQFEFAGAALNTLLVLEMMRHTGMADLVDATLDAVRRSMADNTLQ